MNFFAKLTVESKKSNPIGTCARGRDIITVAPGPGFSYAELYPNRRK